MLAVVWALRSKGVAAASTANGAVGAVAVGVIGIAIEGNRGCAGGSGVCRITISVVEVVAKELVHPEFEISQDKKESSKALSSTNATVSVAMLRAVG